MAGQRMMCKPVSLEDSIGESREPTTKGVAADWILSLVSLNIDGTKDAAILEMTSNSNVKQSRMTMALSSTEAGRLKGNKHGFQSKEQWLSNVDKNGRQAKSPLQDVHEDYRDTYISSKMSSIHLEACTESIVIDIRIGQELTTRKNNFRATRDHSQRHSISTRARTVR